MQTRQTTSATNGKVLDLHSVAPPRFRLRLLDHVVNPVVRLLLRSPLHRLLSGSIILRTYPRRGGAERTIPVAYAQRGEMLVILVGWPEQKRWWRALRRPAPVSVRLRGARRPGVARALVGDGDEVTSALRLYFERFPRAARARGVTEGTLDGVALANAAQTAVVVRLTLHPAAERL